MPENRRSMRVKWPIKSGVYRAQWAAVKHLVDGAGLGEPEFPMPRARFSRLVNRIQRIWWQRAQTLNESAGHLVGGGYTRMQQCPSPFHTSDDPRPTCNRRLLCPWCWCRDTTSDLYKRIDSAVYMHNQKRAIPMNLLAIRANEVLEEPEDYAAVFKMVADEGKKYRRRLNRRAIGAHFNVVLEPLGSGAIRVEHRVLLCLPPDTTHPNLDDVFADEIHHIKSSRKAPLNREKISDLVGWVTRYPAGLLLADAETLSEIGTARKYSRYRLKANLGVLRDSAMRRLLRCHRQ